jgi:nucleoside-diphosphate-sugar epimerase
VTPNRRFRALPRPTAGRVGARPVVAVTGAASPAGRAVLNQLLTRTGDDPAGPGRSGTRPEQIVAIDAADRTDAGRMATDRAAGVLWRHADVASPEVVDSLAGADVVIHLATADDLGVVLRQPATERRVRAVRAAQAVTTAAAAVGAQRLIVVTSAMVLGARPDNPVPLADDATGRADPDDGLIGDLLEIERVLERIPRVHPGLSLTVIRPAALVGPGVDSAVTRHFEAPRLLVLRGASTRWQFCHVEDLATAVWIALDQELDGWLTAGSVDSLAEDDVERLSGMRRLEVPAGLAFSTAERLHRVGVLPTPASELAYVVHPWVIGSTTLAAAGWVPAHDNEGCLRELLEEVSGRRTVVGRRVDRRDAAMGAAGAAVALVGTAAILRQARSRQTRRRRSTPEP